MDNSATYAALLATGFLGGLGHCLGMCGPLVLMLGLRLGPNRGAAAVPAHLLYHAARVAVYALLGAAVGALGSFVRWEEHVSRSAGVLGVALGLGVALMGLGYAGVLPTAKVEAGGAWLTRLMSRALKRGGAAGLVLLGGLNGLLPCCLSYGALLAAASTGSGPRAALAMLLFGLGSMPALVVAGASAAAVSRRLRHSFTRASGALLLLLGAQLCLRGLASLGAVSSVHLGSVVLW